MADESVILKHAPEQSESKRGFYDFKLLRATAYSHLYLACKEGKLYLIKTTKTIPKDKSDNCVASMNYQ